MAQLKQSINNAKQRNIDPENDEDVKQATRALVAKMPFAQKYKELRNAVESMSKMTFSLLDSDVAKNKQEVQSLFLELMNDRCFSKSMEALKKQGLTTVPF